MKTLRTSLLIILIVGSACSAAVAQTESATGKGSEMALIAQQIEAINRKMEEAFRRNDMSAVARFYADDATMFYSRGQKVHGREAIDRYWIGIKEPKDWKLQVVEIGGDRDTIYQVGKSTLTSGPVGKQGTYFCDFVLIWKRQPDGTYKIHIDIYN